MRKIKINYDLILLSMFLFFPATSNYICQAINIISSRLGVVLQQTMFDAIVWSIVLLLCAKRFFYLLKKEHILFALSIWCVMLLLHLFELSSEFTFERFIRLSLFTFPAFFCGAIIKTQQSDFKRLYILSIITLAVSIAYQLLKTSQGEIIAEDNMDFAYKALPSVLIIISGCFYNKRRLLSIILACIATIFLLLQGTRGPLLCALFFFCVMLFKRFGFNKIVILVCSIIVLFAVFATSTYAKKGLLKVSKYVEDIGLSSRIITKLIEDDVADDNGRNAITRRLQTSIIEDPFAFRGLYADREATLGLIDHENSTAYNSGTYAHSIFYELIYDFGVVIGSALFLFLIFVLYRLIKNQSINDIYVVLLFVSCGFVHLFMSGSFVENIDFFFIIGLMFNNWYKVGNKIHATKSEVL